MNLLNMVMLSRSLEDESMCLLANRKTSKNTYSRYFIILIRGFIDYKSVFFPSYIQL